MNAKNESPSKDLVLPNLQWTRDEALRFCIETESLLKGTGFHVALTGGCLYKEGPRKDLDLFLYRDDNFPNNFMLIESQLEMIGLKMLTKSTQSKKDYDGTGLNHFSMQVCCTKDGKRVEIFYVVKEFIECQSVPN